MARAKGIEPLYLGSKPSALTVVLRPNHLMVLYYHTIKMLSEKPTKNQKKWSWREGSNLQPADYKSDALPLRHASMLVRPLGLEPRRFRL